MITFTHNGTRYAILPDATESMWGGFICAFFSIAAFIMGKSEIGTTNGKNNFAYIGIGIDITLLIITIPAIIITSMFA